MSQEHPTTWQEPIGWVVVYRPTKNAPPQIVWPWYPGTMSEPDAWLKWLERDAVEAICENHNAHGVGGGDGRYTVEPVGGHGEPASAEILREALDFLDHGESPNIGEIESDSFVGQAYISLAAILERGRGGHGERREGTEGECDCQNPDGDGVRHISEDCRIHSGLRLEVESDD